MTVRDSYDEVAADYADQYAGELSGKPLDRALLDLLAASAGALGPIADLGCGPGQAAAHLASRAASVLGVDLSPAMVEQARALHARLPPGPPRTLTPHAGGNRSRRVSLGSMFGFAKTKLVAPADALPGRSQPLPVPARHEVLDTPLAAPYPPGTEIAEFGLGCFWGAERVFWKVPGVYSTSVGYEGGHTPNPTYEEVCSGRTGHTEAVRVVFDPARVSYDDLLRTFWENHDPTQGMRQGNDTGTQYRSAVFTHGDAQQKAAEASRTTYQQTLTSAGYPEITTEITPAPTYYFAENYHQQYLSDAKNPNGYCGLGGTGLSCPIGVAPAE